MEGEREENKGDISLEREKRKEEREERERKEKDDNEGEEEKEKGGKEGRRKRKNPSLLSSFFSLFFPLISLLCPVFPLPSERKRRKGDREIKKK